MRLKKINIYIYKNTPKDGNAKSTISKSSKEGEHATAHGVFLIPGNLALHATESGFDFGYIIFICYGYIYIYIYIYKSNDKTFS
jgi:hypothetical protein